MVRRPPTIAGGALASGMSVTREPPLLPSPFYIAIGDVMRRSYFPTERGQWSIENLIARARARLMIRSRAVSVSFECRFERAIHLSCRKNALIYDTRLPGGHALGKVTSYAITVDGDTGTLIGKVTIGCAVGYGNVLAPADGIPSYVDVGYVDLGYQHYDLSVVPLESADVGYSNPADATTDDGLVFPLSYQQAVLVDRFNGTVEAQIETARDLARGQISTQWTQSTENMGMVAQSDADFYGMSPIWYELELRPVTNGPFDAQYNIETTKLMVPKMMDLEAESWA